MRHQQPGSGLPPPPNAGVNHAQFQGPGGVSMEGAQSAGGAEGDRRESVYDYHEISVWQMAQHFAAGKKKSKRQQQ